MNNAISAQTSEPTVKKFEQKGVMVIDITEENINIILLEITNKHTKKTTWVKIEAFRLLVLWKPLAKS